MIRLLIFIILFSSPAFAGGVMFQAGGVVAGGACATQTTSVSNPDTGAITTIYLNLVRGQSFTTHPTNVQDLYSVIVSVNSDDLEAAETSTITLRVGTSSNLTTYEVEKTYLFSDGETGEIEFVFDSTYSMPANTLLYIGLQSSLASSDLISLDRNTSGGSYSDGNYYYSSLSSWNMNQSDGAVDLYFKVKVCD